MLLTLQEAAASLKVCSKTLRGMVDEGKLPHVMVGARKRIDPADIAAFIRRRKKVSCPGHSKGKGRRTGNIISSGTVIGFQEAQKRFPAARQNHTSGK